jgi:N-acetylmuramoyl-L-alanine amidase
MKHNTFSIILAMIALFWFTTNNYANENGGRFIVVLDAGHGGKDPGALGKKAYEKDITLAIALKTGAYIEENLKDVKVVYTRKEDVFVPLIERAEIANKNKAQLFVSIHVNAFTSSKPYGTSSYVLGLHRANENFEVAKRENSVIFLEEDYESTYQGFDPNSEESYIIFSVMQNTFDRQSIEMAAMVQDQFRERAMRKDRGVMRQGLLVLAQSSMPGVLIETGFISNPNEEAFLTSKEGQDFIASAIYRAIRDYKNIIESKSNFEAGTNDALESVGLEGNEVANETNKKVADNGKPDEAPKDILAEEKPKPAKSQGDIKAIEAAAPTFSLEKAKEPAQSIPYYNSNDTNVIYHVQISSSFAMLEAGSSFFRGVGQLFVYPSDGMNKYVTGAFSSYEEVKARLDHIKDKFPDAFIIAVKNGKLISLQQAFRETGLKNDIIN